MVDKADAIKLLADGLALAYHEARHVRILTKAGHLPLDPWAALIDLPRDRVEAWRALLPQRKTASLETSAKSAEAVFQTALDRSAADLAVLFSNPNWQHPEAIGGPAWRHVVACVLTLRDIIDAGQESGKGAVDLGPTCAPLVYARHNDGQLHVRIFELDRAVGHETLPLWQRLVTN